MDKAEENYRNGEAYELAEEIKENGVPEDEHVACAGDLLDESTLAAVPALDTSALVKPDGESSHCNGHIDSSEEGECRLN